MTVMQIVNLTTAAAAAVTGGVLFAFSSLVMPALRRLPVPEAVGAMQAINGTAPRSLLMVPLIGSALGAAVVGVWAVAADRGASRPWLIAGAIAAVAAFAVTAGYHVPRNNALAQVSPHSATAAAAWADYAVGWTRMNHVRTALALAAAGLLLVGAAHSRS